jgi:hypothetical protein
MLTQFLEVIYFWITAKIYRIIKIREFSVTDSAIFCFSYVGAEVEGCVLDGCRHNITPQYAMKPQSYYLNRQAGGMDHAFSIY